MTDTILDLARALPASEAALRARKDEFNAAVWEAIGKPSPEMAAFDYMDNIAHAKSATDVLVRRGYTFWLRDEVIRQELEGWLGCLSPKTNTPEKWVQFEGCASTEELSRSAAALLASTGGE